MEVPSILPLWVKMVDLKLKTSAMNYCNAALCSATICTSTYWCQTRGIDTSKRHDVIVNLSHMNDIVDVRIVIVWYRRCSLVLENRSPCRLMPETLPGCRLMAGRDRRFSTETGRISYLLLCHYTFCSVCNLFCLNSIKITTSCYPVPSICCHDLVYDWFESLAQCLHWNVRKRQARLADVSESSDTEDWIIRCFAFSGPSQRWVRHTVAELLYDGDEVCIYSLISYTSVLHVWITLTVVLCIVITFQYM